MKKTLIIIILVSILIIDDIAYKSPYEIKSKQCDDYIIKGDEAYYKYTEVEYNEGGKEYLENAIKYNEKALSCEYALYPLIVRGVVSHIIPLKWTFTKITIIF